MQLNFCSKNAYIISIAVAANNGGYQLTSPQNDIQLLDEHLLTALKNSERVDSVFHINLLSAENSTFLPTKENIRRVFRFMGGRGSSEDVKIVRGSTGYDGLKAPEVSDFVLFYYSGHGMRSNFGNAFYFVPFLPYGKTASGDDFVSSYELAHWLSGIDISRQYMIIDACYSASAVDTKGFKPGPFGDFGLGQLSYEKNMPILVASQGDLEVEAQGYSSLTRDLFQEGLGLHHALPNDSVSVVEFFHFGVERGKSHNTEVTPILFNFNRPSFLRRKFYFDR